MGKESGGGGGQSRIIFLLIVCVHLATSQRPDDKAKAEEAPPCPPSPPQLPYSSLNSCPNHLITEFLEAPTCTPPPPPPHDDDGDLNPVSGMTSDQTVTLTDGAVVLALLKPRNDKGTPWEIVLMFLMFRSAMYVLLFCDISLRNMYPRFVEVFEKLLAILFVNGVMAFLLPAECFWVPLLCFSSSLLALIIAPFLS